MASVFAEDGRAATIYGPRIDGVDPPTRFQQGGNQQAVGRFDHADHLLFLVGPRDLFQKGIQFGQSLLGVLHPKRTHLPTCLVKHHGVMFLIRPINASKNISDSLLWGTNS